MIKYGTCIYRDDDGQLKIIDINKVVAVVEVEEPDLTKYNTMEMPIRCEITEVCTEFDKKYIEKQLKEFTNILELKLSE